MKTKGRHLLVEYQRCDRSLLDDRDHIEYLMRRAAEAARATIIGTIFRMFTPQGVSGVVVVEESHLSIHTWPEYGYAAVDFYTCGDCIPEAAHRVLLEGLRAGSAEVMAVERGRTPPGPSMRVLRHETAEAVSACHGESTWDAGTTKSSPTESVSA